MISIITVTYNNFDDLHRTLDSLKEIDGIEKIVANGGECAQIFIHTFLWQDLFRFV